MSGERGDRKSEPGVLSPHSDSQLSKSANYLHGWEYVQTWALDSRTKPQIIDDGTGIACNPRWIMKNLSGREDLRRPIEKYNR